MNICRTPYILLTLLIMTLSACGDDSGTSGVSEEVSRLEDGIGRFEEGFRDFCDLVFACFPEDQQGFSIEECYADGASIHQIRSEPLTPELLVCLEAQATLLNCLGSLSCGGIDAWFVALNRNNFAGAPCGEETLRNDVVCEAVGPEPEELPSTVRVSVSGAAINVGKHTGEPWDGPAGLDQKTLEVLATLGGVPYPEVVAKLTSGTLAHLAKPDPFGVVSLDTGRGYGTTTALPTVKDTFLPSWRPVDYNNVPLTPRTRLRITLDDEDLAFNDSIGSVEIVYEDLAEAWYAGQVYHVYVGDQSFDQLLYISISVR